MIQKRAADTAIAKVMRENRKRDRERSKAILQLKRMERKKSKDSNKRSL